MKSKIYFQFSWLLLIAAFLYYGCTDLELIEKAELQSHDIDLSSREVLSNKFRDSTINAENKVVNSYSAA